MDAADFSALFLQVDERRLLNSLLDFDVGQSGVKFCSPPVPFISVDTSCGTLRGKEDFL